MNLVLDSELKTRSVVAKAKLKIGGVSWRKFELFMNKIRRILTN